MNNLYVWRHVVPAKLFAVVTIVSLILSAFPAHFFVAEAIAGPAIETQDSPAASYAPDEEIPFTATRNGFSTGQKLTVQLSSSNGGSFSAGNSGGNCTGSFDQSSITIASNADNKAFCYKNANEGSDTITATFVDEQSSEMVDTFDIVIEGQDYPEYFCKVEGNDGFHKQPLTPVKAQELNDGGDAGLMGSGVNENNIIPPFGDFGGYNWDEGQSIWNDECEYKKKPEPELTSDLRVCKILIDENFEAIDGGHLDSVFSVLVQGPDGFNTTVVFDTPLDLNSKLLNDTGVDPDAECVLFEGVATGKYTYEEEEITGDGEWLTPLYHDFFTKVPTTQADFGEYTIDGSNEDNDDTDGVINLGKNKNRTLAIWNSEVPPAPVCEIGENLLSNGSFEEPVIKKDWVYTAITDWVITALDDEATQDGELHRGWSGNQAADGEQYAELDSRESVKMAQTVPTVKGATYELKWAFAPRHNIAADENQLSVYVNGGTPVATEGPASLPAGLTPADWTRSAYTFVAESDQTTIAFADSGVNSNSFGTFLDDTALCFVRDPEPEPEEPDVCSLEGKVIDYSDPVFQNNGDPVDTDRRDPTAVETLAAYSNFSGKEPSWSTSDFFSLGIGGYLVYEFTDKIAVDQPGDDIAIWEITGGNSGQSDEKVDVYLSEDGVNFEFAGQLTGDGAVDIADTSLDYVKFVKLVDQSAGVQGGSGDGFDVDAITIIDGSCDDYAMVHTTKVVCEDESELPNWNTDQNGGPKITADTLTTDWVLEDHPSCAVVDGWEFEWAPQSASDPGDTLVGPAGASWTTFTGSTIVPASAIDGKNLWMREVLQEGYIPFTYEAEGDKNTDNYTAEFYCHTDGLNYDNYDRIDNPKADGEYYCVAWNVPAEPEQCELDIYSDEMTLVEDTNELAVATYDGNKAWTADIPGATWIWATDEVENPESQETYTFVETFEVENPTEASITIAYDNWLKFYVNGKLIDDRTGTNGYQDFQKQTYDILNELVPGENRIELEITNEALGGSNYRNNPAGVLFHFSAKGDADSCERTTEPKDEMYLIDGYKFEGQYVREVIEVSSSLIPIINGVPGLEGWTIELYDGEGNYITSTSTDDEGHYYFWVAEGEYEVREVVKPGWMQVGVQDGGDYVYPDDGPYGCFVEFPLDDDYQYNNSISVFYEGEEHNNSDYRCDFYNVQEENEFYRVEGTKYEVFNGDNATPLSGWTIYAGNGLSTTSATTDGSGNYSFELPAGEWDIFEVIPSGWFQYAVEENGLPVSGDRCEFEFSSNELLIAEDSESCDFYNEQQPTITTTSTGGGGGGGTRVREPATQQELVAGAATSFCPFLKDHMQMAWDNDSFEVMKLQMFLNIIMREDLTVNGEFDAATAEAVKRFQERYHDDILTPWFEQGIVPHDRPTGFVYKTTRWKINDIVCPGYEPYPSFDGEDLTSNVALN